MDRRLFAVEMWQISIARAGIDSEEIYVGEKGLMGMQPAASHEIFVSVNCVLMTKTAHPLRQSLCSIMEADTRMVVLRSSKPGLRDLPNVPINHHPGGFVGLFLFFF